MNITLKLYATLGKYLPESADANVVEIEIPDNATPYEVVDRFNVPREMVHLVLLNGVYLDPDQRAKQVMKHGDALAIWPPVAGG